LQGVIGITNLCVLPGAVALCPNGDVTDQLQVPAPLQPPHFWRP
jgi:hypothetical protein